MTLRSQVIKFAQDCVDLQLDLCDVFGCCLTCGQHLRIYLKQNKVEAPSESYKFADSNVPAVDSAKCLGITFELPRVANTTRQRDNQQSTAKSTDYFPEDVES